MKAVIGKNEGFTLLELLISLVLSMLVLVIVGGAMKLGFSSVRSGERRADLEERFTSVCNILDSQIQGMVVLAPRQGQDYSFHGDSSKMQFASDYSIWGNRRGCVFVKYTVETGQDGKQVFRAEETITGTKIKKQTVLLPAADSVGFKYFVRKLKGEKGEWVDRLKAGRLGKEVLDVGIDLVYGPRNTHMIIPVNVRGIADNIAGLNQ
ncbi:MAG: prepilin-type N-terminal cleavage/methylation domain-containing protein [Nitrospiraceae bacterium]|nr:prepilin-type N-terminal cleavage/methylation domain-containing protein [Nitrospiraceae bacterium]